MLPIINGENIIAELTKDYTVEDKNVIKRAVDFATLAHAGQKRGTGEDYVQHPLYVALQLAELRMDTATIVAAILHDVPEDTAYSIEDVKKNFGKEVAKLVEGVTKLGTLKYHGLERYAENLRRMFLAMISDVRIIIIKFADRLHNLKTLEGIKPDKRERIALETLEIYAPIANRLGIDQLRGELEDLAFQYALPKEYAWVRELAQHKIQTDSKIVDQIKKRTQKKLVEENIAVATIGGRLKRYYSTYKKLLRKGKDINKIYDFIAIRIIVKNPVDCYRVLGIVHKLWTPIRGRIKDYIAQPKPNGYQSLHTTVFGEKGKIVEFQIRDETMHALAEYGVAAHWFFKELGAAVADLEKMPWIKNLLEIQKSLKNNNHYLEKIKMDIFNERIFVFTPKGDVIDLPQGATPVDFAYCIHTDVGNQCVGAMINDRIASLDSVLSNGDMVEIVINKHRNKPNEDWLAFIKTSIARDKIKQALKSSRLKNLAGLLKKK
jgi:GTP pyrophosphokinase